MGRRVSIIFVGVSALVAHATAAAAAPPVPEQLRVAGLGASTVRATPPAARAGELGTRPVGFPRTDEPAQNMVSAVVTQDLRASRVTGTITLGAAPVPATDSFLGVSFGKVENGGCVSEFDTGSYLTPPIRPGYAVSGATVTFDIAAEVAATGQWNCAVALLYPPGAIDPSTAFDGLSGNLIDVEGTPQLQISEVAVEGNPVKKLKLEPGDWTTIEVAVSNRGDGDAGKVTISGKGKGLKVKKGSVPALDAGAEASGAVRVKLAPGAKRKTALKLTAQSSDQTAKKKIKVKAAKR